MSPFCAPPTLSFMTHVLCMKCSLAFAVYYIYVVVLVLDRENTESLLWLGLLLSPILFTLQTMRYWVNWKLSLRFMRSFEDSFQWCYNDISAKAVKKQNKKSLLLAYMEKYRILFFNQNSLKTMTKYIQFPSLLININKVCYW